MRRILKRLGHERGVTVTEFAILTPVLFLLILTIIEGGRVFSAWLIITNEAREGARYGVVRYGDPSRQPTLVTDVKSRVQSRIGDMLDTSSGNLAVSVQLNDSDPSLSVAVDYKVDIVTPLVQSLVPNPFPLRAVSIMRAE